jgi:hypothetical protein
MTMRALSGALSGVVAAMFAAYSPVAPAAAQESADVVFVNGNIHTQDSAHRIVEGLALRGKSIVALGSNAAVSEFEGSKTKKIDLQGRLMLPGFIDAHVHPAESAQMADKCSLNDKAMPYATIQTKIQQCIKQHPIKPGRWFEVVMVNPTGATLTMGQLDKIQTAPLILEGADGHTVWLNSAAMAAAHIDKQTKDPAGGRIEHDAGGNPSGALRDNATLLGLSAVPAESLEEQASLLKKTLEDMHAVGITSVQDAAVDEHLMSLYKYLYDRQQLDMRVRGSFHIKDLKAPAADILREAQAFRQHWAVDPDFLKADAVKIFADGVIEYPSQTAALLEPYLDAAGKPTQNRGPSYFTQEGLDQIVTAIDAADFTVHIHAIGDRAVRSSLDAFEAARQHNGKRDNRDQIAHLELISPQDFPRFKSLGVIANFQLLWAEREVYIDEGTVPYLGAERSKYLYPARSLKDAGAIIAGGSDWGVSSFDPFLAMEHGITRAEFKGRPPLLPEQALNIADMVDAYTANAAYALKQEKTTGSLEVGKRGDLVVIDRDIFKVDPFDLHKARVLSTYLDGREVYSRH